MTDSGDEDTVFATELSSATSLSSQQRAELSRQKYTQQQEAEPLAPLYHSVKDGEHIPQGRVIELQHGQEATCVSVAGAASMVAVGCHSGDVLLLDPNSQQLLDAVELQDVPAAVVTAVRFRPPAAGGDTNTARNSNSLLLVAKGGKLLQVHTGTRSIVSQNDEGGNKINNTSIRQDGQLYATAGSDAVVRVYDDTHRTPLLRMTQGDGQACYGHTNNVFGLVWKPEDCQVLLSAGWDGTVQVWDMRLGRSVRSIAGGSWVCGDGLDVQGNKVLTGSWRDKQPLQLWDYGSGRLLTNLPFYQPQQDACLLYAARFGPAGGATEGLLAAGGSGKAPIMRLYNRKGHLLSTLHTQSAVHAIDWVSQKSQQGSTAVSASAAATTSTYLLAVCCAHQVHLLAPSAKPRN